MCVSVCVCVNSADICLGCGVRQKKIVVVVVVIIVVIVIVALPSSSSHRTHQGVVNVVLVNIAVVGT